MALLHPFSGTEAKAKQPINEDLTDLKYKENIEDLAAQIDAISGGGSGGAADTGAVGEILLGGHTDEAVFWKRRFSVVEHMLAADSSNPSGFNPESDSLKNELLTFLQTNDSGIVKVDTTADEYLSTYIQLDQGSSFSFKIKKGINFFSIMGVVRSLGSTDIVVTIDGQSVSSLGLTDENGIARTDSYSQASSTTFYQATEFFYGLDGEEHTIQVKHNSANPNHARISAIEVGYRTPTVAIDENIYMSSGKANVRGTEVSFDEATLSFGKTNKNGHTGSIVCDNTGALSVLDGESPAMTQVKAEEEISFSSVVTALPVRNTFYFPENGICMLSTPYGNHHMFSYSSKTDTLVQSHSLDNIKWQSQPTEDFTPLEGFTGGQGSAKGDLNINYWGTAPIEIDSTNNKLDFEITIGGVTTVHAATIPSGRYAADLVPLEKAVRTAMQAVKPLIGEYHLKYNETSQLWSIYVSDKEVEEFSVLFGTGINLANSIHPTLGFANTDKSGALSYIGSTEVQHLCCRVLEKENVFIHAEDPRIKYSYNNDDVSFTEISDIRERLNLGSIRVSGVGATMVQIFPDKDCCGLELSFTTLTSSAMAVVQIDDGQMMYLNQMDTTIYNGSVARGIIRSAFISFPRGSRKITIRNMTADAFELISTTTTRMMFVGARQYFTKPSYEKLTKTQAILKSFDVSPASIYATVYGHNGGVLYSPAAQDDQINTITESANWSGATSSDLFNRGNRITSTDGSYVDVDFTLQGDGGGISLKGNTNTNRTIKAAMFISSSAINEATDRVCNSSLEWATSYPDIDNLKLLGLKAGTYIARFKNEDGGGSFMDNLGFTVYDTVPPQENANTVSDVNNTGQGVTYPVNVVREPVQKDSSDRVPVWLDRSGYKEGRVSKVNYVLNSPTVTNYDDSSSIINNAEKYYGSFIGENVVSAGYSVSAFMKSISLRTGCFNTFETTATVKLDGISMLNTTSSRVQVKGGTSPSSSRSSSYNIAQKIYSISCTFNSGDTFDLSDTRGISAGQKVIIFDGTNKETVVVLSVVAGISFTVKKARSIVVDANVVSVEFQGFHNLEITQGTTNQLQMDVFEYEPLTISPSKSLQRNEDMVYEKVSVNFRGVVNGGDIYYPVHSDGVVGNWSTSTVEVIQKDVDTGYNLDQDLKNINITAGKTMSFKITSERLVPKLNEKDRF